MTFNLSTLFKWRYCFGEQAAAGAEPSCILTSILKAENPPLKKFWTHSPHLDLEEF